MPERSEHFHKISSKTLSQLKWLEDVRFYVGSKKGTLKNEMERHRKPDTKKKSSKLKTVNVTISLTGEW